MRVRQLNEHVFVPDHGPVLNVLELTTLQGAADGETSKETAGREFYSEDTVKTAMKTARAKLGAKNRTHAVAIAIRTGLIT